MVGKGFLGRLLGISNTQTSRSVPSDLSKELEDFQGYSLSYLRDVRTVLSRSPVNRNEIRRLSETFYRFYFEFTDRENILRTDKDVYKDFKLLRGLIGPVYASINQYVSNKDADPKALFNVVDKGIRMIAKRRIPIPVARSSSSRRAAA